MKIHDLSAREILDSRGNPTISCSVELDDGTITEASVPSGASTGTHEKKELRDKDKARFHGMGVLYAVRNVNETLNPNLCGMDAAAQSDIDRKMIELDGTPDKSNIGANAILAVSLAVARAQAISSGVELFEYLSLLFNGKKNTKYTLPTPMFNILNGGKHAENNIDIQETMIVPTGYTSFFKKLEIGSEIYHTLKTKLTNDGYSVGLGDEGGFAPDFEKNEDVISYISKLVEETHKDKVRISMDLAASELYDSKKGQYFLKNEKKYYSSDALIQKLSNWGGKYNLFSIEDGLAEDDPSWKKLTEKVGSILTIGDDLFTTDAEKIELGAKEKMAGGVLIKPNQIGTLTETIKAIKIAKENSMKVIISHRSGDTEDSFIADLAVGVSADFIKSGAPARSERLAKYNRLSRIEDVIKEYE